MKLVNPSEECFERMYQEFGINEEYVKDGTRVLKEWYRQQPHLPQIDYDDCVFKSLLLHTKFSVERCKQVLDVHSSLKAALPEFFSNRDPFGADLKAQMDSIEMVSLSRCTKEGHRVYIGRAKTTDTSKFNLCAVIKLLFMFADIRLTHYEDYATGEVYILDLANLAVGHVTAMSLTLIKKAEIVFQKGYSARIIGVHFINPPPLVEMLMPVLLSATRNKKLKSRVRVHATIDTLYDFVERELLPEDYGGQERKINAIWADWRSELEGRRDWFKEQERMCKVDETKRPGKSFDKNELFGFEGTFKQLTVD